MGLGLVEESDLKYPDIYGKVAQSFRATHLIPVLSQSMESADFIPGSKTFLPCTICLGLYSETLEHGLVQKPGRICKLSLIALPIQSSYRDLTPTVPVQRELVIPYNGIIAAFFLPALRLRLKIPIYVCHSHCSSIASDRNRGLLFVVRKLLVLTHKFREDIVGLPGHFLRGLLCRCEAERAVDHIDGTTVDDIGGEGVDVDRVLRTHYLSSAHSVENAHLLGREVRLKLFRIPRTAEDLQVFDPFQDSVALGGVHGHEGVQAKVNCLGHFLLGELAVDVSSPLNYCNSSATIGVEGGLLSSTETVTGSEVGKRALKACFVLVAEYRLVMLPDLLQCAQDNEQEASVTFSNLFRVPLESLVFAALTLDGGADSCGSRKPTSHGKVDGRLTRRKGQ